MSIRYTDVIIAADRGDPIEQRLRSNPEGGWEVRKPTFNFEMYEYRVFVSKAEEKCKVYMDVHHNSRDSAGGPYYTDYHVRGAFIAGFAEGGKS